MARKPTVMQQRAIDALFDGKTKTKKEALEKAGYDPETRVGSVFDSPIVKKEIENKRSDLARKHGVNQDYIVGKLKKICDADIGDLIVVDKDGSAELDYRKLTPAHRAAIESVQITEDPISGKRTTKLNFTKKLAALNDLQRYLSLFEESDGDGDLINALMRGRKRVRMLEVSDE